jgi:hypothetical protein
VIAKESRDIKITLINTNNPCIGLFRSEIKGIFGKQNVNDQDIRSIYYGYGPLRLFLWVRFDLRKMPLFLSVSQTFY